VRGVPRFAKYIDLYLLLIPGVVVVAVFKYVPMYGIVIAFQDFNIFRGIGGSEWVGLMHFRDLFSSLKFYSVLRNTILISVYKIVFTFPIPIVLALFLNEIRSVFFKRTVQSIIYLPHFISWVVVSGMFISLLSPTSGLVQMFTGGDPVILLMEPGFFRPLIVGTQAWRETGWGTIIYLAAIAGIDQQMYEAAVIDGAGRFRQMWSITLPSIVPTIILLFIIRLGYLLNAGTEQVLLFYNPLVYDVGDIIGTYVYRMGLGKMEYSFSTAVGLFNSAVGFVLILSANRLSRRVIGRGIW
jgi:putative aldouronate transport system permease protein